MSINQSKKPGVAGVLDHSVESIYRENAAHPHRSAHSPRSAEVSNILGKISKRVSFHFLEVRIGAFTDLWKDPATVCKEELKIDLVGYENTVFDMRAAELFVKEKCVDGLFQYWRYFPAEIHVQIAEMLMDKGYWVEALKNCDRFTEVSNLEILGEFEEYLSEGGHVNVRDLVAIEDQLEEGCVYRLLKLMTQKGNGELVLEACHQGLKPKHYDQTEIVSLHIQFLNENLNKNLNVSTSVKHLLSTLKDATIVFPKKGDDSK